MLAQNMLCVLVLSIVTFTEGSSGSGDEEGSGSGNVFLSAQEANTFQKTQSRCIACISEGHEEVEESREKRVENAEEVEEHNLDDSELRAKLLGCCGTDNRQQCSGANILTWQKRAGSGGINPDKFVSRICEISLRENHGQCWCAGKRCGLYYYEKLHSKCANPCKHTEFYCKSTAKLTAKTRLLSSSACVAKSTRCDSKKDCPEAEDEDGCKITDRLSGVHIKSTAWLSFSGYQFIDNKNKLWDFPRLDNVGVAFVNYLAICKLQGEKENHGLTQKMADVFCRMMKNAGPKTRGLPFTLSSKGLFGIGSGIFTYPNAIRINPPIMTDVACKGDEDHIGLCVHKTYNKRCKILDYLAVACLDTEKLKLTGKRSSKFQGDPVYIDLPIAYERATYQNTAKTICTTLLGEEFGRGDDGVPYFHALGVQPVARLKPCLKVSCNNVKATINDCQFEFNIWCTARTYLTEVRCAQCSISTLQSIVDGIKVEEKSSVLISNIIVARSRLEAECRWWDDCLNKIQRYKEYCMVKNFIDNAFYTLQPEINRSYMKGNNIIYLPSQMTDSKKLLEITELRLQFSETNGLIGKVGEQITTRIGEYFNQMANFDRDLAKADAGYAFGKWKQSKKAAANVQSNLDPLLSRIITATIKSADDKVMFENGIMSLTIFNALNPKRWATFDFGGISEVAGQLHTLQEAKKDKLKLVSYLPDQFKALENHASTMSDEISKNEAVFIKVNSLVMTGKKEIAITDYESSQRFLGAYNDYTPAVTKNGVSTLVNLVEELVEKCCETIEGSVSRAAQAEIKAQSCPKIKSQLASLEAYFEDLEEQQFDIMDSLARMARAKVAEHNALELKNTGKGAKPMLTKTLLKKNIEVVLRTQRLMYINDACNYLTYMRYGEVNKACRKLMEDPTLSKPLLEVIAQREVKICKRSHMSENWVKIPISSIKNEDGYLNITALFDPAVNRRAAFTIPSRQWLVDHKWIYDSDTKPFYIQNVNLHLPPTNGKKNQYRIVIKFSGLNKIGDKMYKVAGEQLLTNEYTENKKECSLLKSFSSKYKVKECKGNLNKVCIQSQGSLSNRILPVLVGNTWSISMELQKGRTKPLHVSDGYVYAFISICSKYSSKKRSEIDARAKVPKGRKCCPPNQVWSEENKQCVACPSNYQPYLWDTFCEMCLPGYQSAKRKFGCKACPNGKFKAKSGPGQCQDCAAGSTTKGIAATECVKSGV